MVIGQEYSHFSHSTKPRSTGCHVRTLVSMANYFRSEAKGETPGGLGKARPSESGP